MLNSITIRMFRKQLKSCFEDHYVQLRIGNLDTDETEDYTHLLDLYRVVLHWVIEQCYSVFNPKISNFDFGHFFTVAVSSFHIHKKYSLYRGKEVSIDADDLQFMMNELYANYGSDIFFWDYHRENMRNKNMSLEEFKMKYTEMFNKIKTEVIDKITYYEDLFPEHDKDNFGMHFPDHRGYKTYDKDMLL